MKSTIRWVGGHVKQRDELFSNAEHEAEPATTFTESGGESHAARSGRSSLSNFASLDALWLLLPTGGRRCSASAVRLSARREPGQRGHEAFAPTDL